MGGWEDGRMGGWEDGRMGGWEDGRMIKRVLFFSVKTTKKYFRFDKCCTWNFK
jgi:hypothetical protein